MLKLLLLVPLIAGSFQLGAAVICYQCNSEFDPRCGDPFDPYSLGTVNCSFQPRREHIPDFEPVLCRKTKQYIEGKIRIIRACGYVEDPQYDDKQCMVRTGTHEVRSIYCSCKDNLCNHASSPLIQTSNLRLYSSALAGPFLILLLARNRLLPVASLTAPSMGL